MFLCSCPLSLTHSHYFKVNPLLCAPDPITSHLLRAPSLLYILCFPSSSGFPAGFLISTGEHAQAVPTCLKFVTALITGEAVIRRLSSDGKLISNFSAQVTPAMPPPTTTNFPAVGGEHGASILLVVWGLQWEAGSVCIPAEGAAEDAHFRRMLLRIRATGAWELTLSPSALLRSRATDTWEFTLSFFALFEKSSYGCPGSSYLVSSRIGCGFLPKPRGSSSIAGLCLPVTTVECTIYV